MEFVNLGEHCSEPICNQLDFLPFKCDACMKIFCKQHYKYLSHNCKESHLKEKQVPICPLCDRPIVCKNGQTPDETISNHIDIECIDDRATKKRNKIYTNRCSYKGCKQKELIELKCSNCNLNHCLKHRHPVDHNCNVNMSNKNGYDTRSQINNAYQQSPAKAAANAALQRFNIQKLFNNTTATTTTANDNINKAHAIQGALSEDEALRKALQMSLATESSRSSNQQNHLTNDNETKLIQEEEDRILARAIQESQRDFNRNKERCTVS